MTTQATVFTKLKDPPTLWPTLSINGNRLLSLNRNTIIVSVPVPAKLLMYDLDKQRITKEFHAPDTIDGAIYHHCIDSKNNVVYAVIRAQLVSVDLIKNEWNVIKKVEKVNIRTLITVESLYFVPSTNKLYIDRKSPEKDPEFFSDSNSFWRDINSILMEDDQYVYRKSTDQLFRKRLDGEILYSDKIEQ